MTVLHCSSNFRQISAMMMDDDEWDDGEDHLEQTHNTLQQYFARNIQNNDIIQQPTIITTSSSSTVNQTIKEELSINDLSREQLSSLSKEELIELLTSNSKKQKGGTGTLKRRSKSPRTKNPRLRSSSNSKDGVSKTKSQPHLEETSGITRLPCYANPSDSQSEQPSEQRNMHVTLNPLPPEQEERETPHSEPESSEENRKRLQSNHSSSDSLLSSTDTSDLHSKKKLNSQDPILFDDIAALESSIEPRAIDMDDAHDEDIIDDKWDTITSTDETQVIAPIVRTRSLKEKEINREQYLESRKDLIFSADAPKNKKRRRRSSSKKLKRTKSGLKKSADSKTKRKKRSNPDVRRISKSKSPREPINNNLEEGKEDNNESSAKIINNDILSSEKHENNVVVVQQLQPIKRFPSLVEEDDETDDSYDVEEEITEDGIFSDHEKSKPKKKSKLGNQKSVQHLLDMFGPVPDEIKQEDPVDEDQGHYIKRGEGTDDPRRYLEIGKVLNISQKILAVSLLCFFQDFFSKFF